MFNKNFEEQALLTGGREVSSVSSILTKLRPVITSGIREKMSTGVNIFKLQKDSYRENSGRIPRGFSSEIQRLSF